MDERGAAALLTVHLDDYFNGLPVQHREVQGHESPLFMSYFKAGIQYLSGGVASAFRTVDRDAFETRLFHVKGKHEVRSVQVPLKASSMNHGDVFILDAGRRILVWNGKKANKYEKLKGMELARKLRDERGAKAEVIQLPDGDSTNQEFWGPIGSFADVQADDDNDEALHAVFRLVLSKITLVNEAASSPEESKGAAGAAPELATEKIAELKLEQTSLTTDGVFIVDNGSHVYIWTGKVANATVKKHAMAYSLKYLEQFSLPNSTPVTRIVEGAEPLSFTSLFRNWVVPKYVSKGLASNTSTSGGGAKASGKDATPIDNLGAMLRGGNGDEAKAKQITSDGKVKVWRIESFGKKEVDAAEYGHFSAGDSYIVIFTYEVKGKPNNIAYFWQGRDSTVDERGTSAFLTVSLAQELDGSTTQVRVVQGKEPDHFLSLFRGRMIVSSGGVDSGFKNHQQGTSTSSSSSSSSSVNAAVGADGVRLYHVKGTNSVNTRAVEVLPVAASLNSGDVFLASSKNDGILYIWYGQYANQDERKYGLAISSLVSNGLKTVEINEGSETPEFWAALGGETEYVKDQPAETAAVEPRLFHCSNVSGKFRVVEVPNFTQDDLINDDVMLLDTYNEVFVWIGSESNREEKEQSKTLALDFIENATDGRSKDTPVYHVPAGHEPLNFTSYFRGWDFSRADKFVDLYAKRAEFVKKTEEEAKRAEAEKAVGGASAARALWQNREKEAAAVATGAPSLNRPLSISQQLAGSSTTAIAKSLASPTGASLKAAERVTRANVSTYADPATKKYTVQELKRRPRPDDVNPDKLTEYLTDDDFAATFGMPRAEFNKLQQWRQVELVRTKL